MSPVQEEIKPAARTSSAGLSLKNVLFATDFSATSEIALPYATAVCRRFGGTLHAVHVLSDAGLIMMTGGVDYVSLGTLYDDAHAEATERLEKLTASLAGIPHRSYVRHGQVWNNLAPIIEENQVDLIVLGTHGRTGLGKLLLGSVAEDILRHAPCPVLTIGPKVTGRDKLPAFRNPGRDLVPLELDLRQILLATNFAPSSERLTRVAVSLAAEFCSRLTLVHVLEDYTQLGSNPEPITESTRRLRELVPPGAPLQNAPETVLEFGSAHERILKVATDREADLIVIGARTKAEAGTTHLPWSNTYRVIAHAHCPVLTIRG